MKINIVIKICPLHSEVFIHNRPNWDNITSHRIKDILLKLKIDLIYLINSWEKHYDEEMEYINSWIQQMFSHPDYLKLSKYNIKQLLLKSKLFRNALTPEFIKINPSIPKINLSAIISTIIFVKNHLWSQPYYGENAPIK